MAFEDERRNHYRLLHVQHDAPHAVIKSSYRAMMRELEAHPDRGGDEWNAALLNEAYRVLSDPDERARYDLELDDERLGRVRSDANVDDDRAEATDTADDSDVPDATDDRGRATGFDDWTMPTRSCPFCRASWSGTVRSCPTCASPTELEPVPAIPDEGRRSAGRVARDGWLRYWTEWPGEPSVGALVDLAAGGLRFTAGEELVGPNVKIKGPLVDALGRVAFCRRRETDWAIGVEFITVQWHRERGTFVSTQA